MQCSLRRKNNSYQRMYVIEGSNEKRVFRLERGRNNICKTGPQNALGLPSCPELELAVLELGSWQHLDALEFQLDIFEHFSLRSPSLERLSERLQLGSKQFPNLHVLDHTWGRTGLECPRQSSQRNHAIYSPLSAHVSMYWFRRSRGLKDQARGLLGTLGSRCVGASLSAVVSK